MQYANIRNAKADYPAAMAFFAQVKEAESDRTRRHLSAGERRELEAIRQQAEPSDDSE